MIYIVSTEVWRDGFKDTVIVTTDFDAAVRAFNDACETATCYHHVQLSSYVDGSCRPGQTWLAAAVVQGKRRIRYIAKGQPTRTVETIEETP